MIEEQYRATSLPGRNRAHEAGSTGSDDDHIVGFRFRTFAQCPPWSEEPIWDKLAYWRSTKRSLFLEIPIRSQTGTRDPRRDHDREPLPMNTALAPAFAG